MNRVGLLVRRYGFDALLVLTAIWAALEVALRHDAEQAPRVTVWFAFPAAALVALMPLGRRRFPFVAPAMVWLLAVALSVIDGRLVVFASGIYAAGLAAAFLLGHLEDQVRARAGLLLVLSAAFFVVYNDPNHSSRGLLFVPLTFAFAWLGGFVLRERAVRADAAEERAAYAERERESATRVAVAEERARIARELHDVVAHAVSVMVLQVGAVRHRLPPDFEQDRTALADVERAGRTALTEMRRLLGAMRSDAEGAELTPQPGLDSLEALLEGTARAGLPVHLHIEGDPFPLPRGIDLSAYRIVQEGLTNALRHARAERADVTIHYSPAELRIDVRDDGVGRTRGDGQGHGLVGVRERVKLYGGHMTAGAAPEGGFVLSTRLPLEDDGR